MSKIKVRAPFIIAAVAAIAVGAAAFLSNTALQKGTFLTVTTKAKPDLVISLPHFTGYRAENGQKHLILTVVVKNASTAKFAKNFTIQTKRYALAGGLEIAGSGTVHTMQPILPLAAPKIELADYTACALKNTGKISVRVDSTLSIPESNENNNYIEINSSVWKTDIAGVTCN